MTTLLKLVAGFLVAFTWLPSPITPKSFHKLEEIIASNKLLSLRTNSSFNSFSIISKPKSHRLSYYGDSCEKNEDCAPHSGLACTNFTCICSSPEFIARHNPDKSPENIRRTECVLRAGSKCGAASSFRHRNDYGNLETRTRTLSASYLWNKLQSNVPFLSEITGGSSSPMDFFDGEGNCIDNAHCTGGVCRCSPDHFKDHRGLCLRKRTIFQPCESDSQCRTAEGLYCNEGKCVCTKSMVFDRVKRKCFIPVGGECDAYSSNNVDMECVRNADCSNGRCSCMAGYKMSSDGSCGLAFGGSCDMQTNVCSDIQLNCRSGVCQCRYPVHQVYNETLAQCLSKPDGPCIPSTLILAQENEITTGFHQNCVPFAECVKSNFVDEASSMFDYVCKCLPGFSEDSAGNCEPSYLHECLEDDDCDQIGQLSCVNGHCSCPDEMLTWDSTRRKCVGVVSARCKYIQLERLLSFKTDVPTECIQNAVCMEHVPQLDGRCECKTGYQFSKLELKCIPSV